MRINRAQQRLPDMLRKRGRPARRGVEADFNGLLGGAVRHRFALMEPQLIAEALVADAREGAGHERQLPGLQLVMEIDRQRRDDAAQSLRLQIGQ